MCFRVVIGAAVVAFATLASLAASAAPAMMDVAAAPALASARLAKPLQQTRILVLGGTGRNGSAIVVALEAAGAKPRVLVRDLAKARGMFPGEREWIVGDVTRPETLGPAVEGIDVIINAVAASQIEGPNGVEAVDLGGMRNLISAAKPAKVKRMIFISGQAVGRDPSEWTIPALKRGYGAKREAEKLLIASGLEYTILRPTRPIARPGNAWAIGIFDQREFHRPSEEALVGQPREVPPPEQTPPAATIARPDLAEVAIVAAVHPSARNRVFVVSHGEGRASAAWAAQLERMPRD